MCYTRETSCKTTFIPQNDNKCTGSRSCSRLVEDMFFVYVQYCTLRRSSCFVCGSWKQGRINHEAHEARALAYEKYLAYENFRRRIFNFFFSLNYVTRHVQEGGTHRERRRLAGCQTVIVDSERGNHVITSQSANHRRRRYRLADGWSNVSAEYEHTGTFLLS